MSQTNTLAIGKCFYTVSGLRQPDLCAFNLTRIVYPRKAVKMTSPFNPALFSGNSMQSPRPYGGTSMQNILFGTPRETTPAISLGGHSYVSRLATTPPNKFRASTQNTKPAEDTSTAKGLWNSQSNPYRKVLTGQFWSDFKSGLGDGFTGKYRR